MALGRPTIYTEELADKICELIAISTKGLVNLCAEHDWMPTTNTIYLWRHKYVSFSHKYLKAKENQINLIIENIDEAFDEANLNWYIDAQGNRRIDAPSAAIAQAKANNKKWYASKIAPKLYGDKQQVETTVKHEDKIENLE